MVKKALNQKMKLVLSMQVSTRLLQHSFSFFTVLVASGNFGCNLFRIMTEMVWPSGVIAR